MSSEEKKQQEVVAPKEVEKENHTIHEEKVVRSKGKGFVDFILALNKFQSEVSNVPKDKDNPYFKSKYADLAGLISVIKQPLADNGFVYIQHPTTNGSRVTIRTEIFHTSGEMICSDLTLTAANPSPHAIASCITMGRRYALMSIMGIAAEEEDDDGNVASSKKPPTMEEKIIDAFSQFGFVKMIIENLVPGKKINDLDKHDMEFLQKIFKGLKDSTMSPETVMFSPHFYIQQEMQKDPSKEIINSSKSSNMEATTEVLQGEPTYVNDNGVSIPY